MADRTVVVRLVAEVGQYQAAVAMAGRTARELAAAANAAGIATTGSMVAMDRAASKASKGIGRSFRSVRGYITTLGIPLAGAAIVRSFADFEKQMANVRAVGDPFGQTVSGMRRMRNEALSVGAQYGFTAKEVGQAESELAKAGLHTAQILGGTLTAALQLAAAGDITLANSAKYLSVIMTQFDRPAGDAVHIANRLAQAANATVSGVDEMATSLSYVGPQAHAAGMSLDDTIATLSVFNKAGLDADMAGTNLRGLLVSLTSPSHLAAAEIRGLGIELYDSTGKFKGIRNLAEELKTKFGGLTQAERDLRLGRIVSNHQLQGSLILMKLGAKGISAMQKVIENSATAEEMAHDKLKSWAGDLSRAGSAINSGVIKALTNVKPQLEWLTHGVERAGNAFGDMSGGAQLVTAALVAQMMWARKARGAVGEWSGGVATAKASAVEYNNALRQLNSRLATQAVGRPDKLYRDQTEALRHMTAGLKTAQTEVGGFSGVVGRAMGNVATSTSTWGKWGAAGMGAINGIGVGLKSLTSFMGGPWGVALAGGMLLYAEISQENAKRKQEAEDLIDALDSLGQAYAMTGNIGSQDIQQLVKKNSLLGDLTRNYKKYGVSIEDVAKSMSGSAAAQDQIIKRLDARRRTVEAMIDRLPKQMRRQSTPEEAATSKHWNDQKKALDRLIPQLKEEYRINREKLENYRALRDAGVGDVLRELGIKADDASQAEKQLAENSLTLGNAQAEAKDRVGALADSLDILHSSLNDVGDAMAGFRGMSFEDTFFDVEKGHKAKKGHKVKDWIETVKKVPTKAHWERTATGETTEEGGHVFTEKFVPAGTRDVKKRRYAGFHYEGQEKATEDVKTPLYDPRMIDTVTGKFSSLVRVNGRYNDELSQTSIKFNDFMSGRASKALGVVKAAWKEATDSGASAGDAAVYAGLKYGQLRKEMVDMLEPITHNRKEAERLVDAYMPMPKEIRTTFATPGLDTAMNKAAELGVHLEQLPDGKVAIVADDKPAADVLAKMGIKLTKLPDGRYSLVFANQAAAQAELDKFLTPPKPRQAPYNAKINESSADAIEKTVRDKAAAGMAAGMAAGVAGSANAVEYQLNLQTNLKTVAAQNMQVTAGTVNVSGPAPKPIRYDPRTHQPLPNRWGGIQMAAAGALRQAKVGKGQMYGWAEPETGGEAFIPRIGDRNRSLRILRQAAGWYGQELVGAGTRSGGTPGSFGVPAAAVTRSAQTSHVNVQVRAYLGNEELTDRMRFVVDQHSSNTARQATWGRRTA